ncbi:hypothetical protein P692DRAFT_20452154 [Suillus brevipes Sb2]|nr:hypothetical protein P692DRAFT_20452154 [Suillus brevipes Sb2]
MALNNGSSSAPLDHSLGELFQCMWVVAYGLHCNDLVRGHEISIHLRQRHNIRGADDLRVRCCWEGCGSEMKKESITRHVQSTHLGIVYSCDTCNQNFTRTYGLELHKRNCPKP